MIEVMRRRAIAAPGAAVRAVLVDMEQLGRLLPHVERLEVQATGENRARVAITVRAGKLGAQRIEGEARMLADGVRFIAVRPVQLDSQWTVQERGPASDVSLRFAVEPDGPLAAISRFIPRRIVEQRIGQELERSLDALQALVMQRQE